MPKLIGSLLFMSLGAFVGFVMAAVLTSGKYE